MPTRTEKDMSHVRRTVPFAAALKNGVKHVELKNYKNNGQLVSLTWDVNAPMKRDKIFILKLGDKEAYLDLEELLSYTRLM
jgi:hypothetical protein